MNLNITDPAFLFPGISLLFLAYTNRYLTIAGIIRALNRSEDERDIENREQQIKSLHLRVVLIKYMQAFAVVAFLCCVLTMICLGFEQQQSAQSLFFASLVSMTISLCLSFCEIMKSGESLKIELTRTR